MKAVFSYFVFLILSLSSSELTFSQELKWHEVGKNDCTSCAPEFLLHNDEFFYFELNDIIYKYDQNFKRVSKIEMNWEKIAPFDISFKNTYHLSENVIIKDNIISFYLKWDKKLKKNICLAVITDSRGNFIETKQLFTFNKNEKKLVKTNWGGKESEYLPTRNRLYIGNTSYLSTANNNFIAIHAGKQIFFIDEKLKVLKIIDEQIEKIDDWAISKSGTLRVLYTTLTKKPMFLNYKSKEDNIDIVEQEKYPGYIGKRFLELDEENDKFYITTIIGRNYNKLFYGKKIQLKIYNSTNSELSKTINHQIDNTVLTETKTKKQKYSGVYQMDYAGIHNVSNNYYLIFEQNDLVRKAAGNGGYEETAKSVNIIIYKIENDKISSNTIIKRYSHSHPGNLYFLSMRSLQHNNKLFFFYNTSQEKSSIWVDPVDKFNICSVENDLTYNCKEYSETVNPMIYFMYAIFKDKLICFAKKKRIISFFTLNISDLN